MRSPLNSKGMTAHMLPHVVNDPAKARACGQQITRSVSVMERMINDLLDYTRTRLGTGMPVKPAPIGPGPLRVNCRLPRRSPRP